MPSNGSWNALPGRSALPSWEINDKMPNIARSAAVSTAVASALAGAALLLSAASFDQRALAHSDRHGAGHAGHGAGHRAGHGAGHGFAAGEPGDPKQAGRTIEIVMSEGPGTMTYSPDRIEVRRGEQVKFVLRNAGELRHEFLIDTVANNARHKIEMEKSPDMAHEEANGRHVEPRRSAELVWRFTKAGIFEFACLIPGHYESGMKGVVVVK
jgi:uncharacterized cupredoxin-like copper-binding protein